MKIGAVRGVLVTMFFLTLLLYAFTTAGAAPKVVEIEGVAYNVSHSMKDNLKALKGKKIYVTTDSGKTMAGSVKQVGDHLLHLEKLEGKDYFDALIRIEEISSFDTRFREFKR